MTRKKVIYDAVTLLTIYISILVRRGFHSLVIYLYIVDIITHFQYHVKNDTRLSDRIC